MASLPDRLVTLQELERLPEYSASYPTGTTPGKLWRCELGGFDSTFMRYGGKPRWIIRQYDPDCPDDAKRINILQFRPVIRAKAGSRPHV